MAKNVKNSSKGSPKKGSKSNGNWKKKVLPLFLAAIMLISIFAYAGSSLLRGNESRNIVLEKDFNSLTDGLKLLPSNAKYVRYVDLGANEPIAAWAYQNLSQSMPYPGDFNAYPKKDLVADFPKNTFGNFTEQFVSITDFGRGDLKMTYNMTEYAGMQICKVNEKYYFTPGTNPVVSGRIEVVDDVLDTMNGVSQGSSYDKYSDLFEQLKGYPVDVKKAKLAAVGTGSKINITDKYFAGITPEGDTYRYNVVLHLSQSFNETERSQMKDAWEKSALFYYGFDYFNVNFKDDYLVIDASGSLDTCIRDMTGVWGFLYS
ncbi:hypothetical protein CUJ83_06445 [Methanocella sp. CWC-04]|uniref:Uncharacterized protein n=1 Tax=Methanooceanicella nereidis TaxID=2052831 RepID=A0AAP2RC46_9EURY|nr:hypothetical protein [Methanocella sp. CWC-04]MCD1294638.1 hypothetical protein [Methanocella sp. CWC-04]